MPLIHRRVFYAKVGAANQSVEHMQEGNTAMVRFGSSINSRVLTGHMTGRSDRVVVVWEVDDIGSTDAALYSIMENP